MRSNLFAKHLQSALAKANAPATESQVAEPVVTDPVVVEPALPAVENHSEPATPAVESQPAPGLLGIDPATGLVMSNEAWFGKSAPKEAEKSEYQKMEDAKDYHSLAKVHDGHAVDPEEIKKDATWLGIPGVKHGGHYHELVASQYRKLAAEHEQRHAATESQTTEPAAVDVTPAVESAPTAPAPAPAPAAAAPAPAPTPAPAPAASTESEPAEGVISAPNGGTETVVVDQVPHMVEHHLICADHVGDHLDSVHEEACDLHKAVMQLESVINAIDLEPNGISMSDAKYVTVAVESITSRWGQDVKIVPSVESFGGPTSRREATLTLESNIKEVVKQVMAYLKNLFAKFVELLKKFWEHLTHGADALKKKAAAVKAKFQGHQVATEGLTYSLEDNALMDRHLASRIAIAGKIPAFHELADVSKRIIAGDFKQSEEEIKAQQDMRQITVEILASNAETFDGIYDRAVETLDKAEDRLGHVPGGLFTQDGGKRTEWIPGGIAYEVEYSDTGFGFRKIHWDGDVETKVVSIPDSAAVVKFATDVEETVDQIQAHLKVLKDFEGFAKESLAEVEKGFRDDGSLTEAQIHKAGKLFARINHAVVSTVKLASSIHYDVIAALSAALDFVGHIHADNHKAEATDTAQHAAAAQAVQSAKAATESQTDVVPATEAAAVEPNQEPKAGNTAENPGGGEGDSKDAPIPTQEPAAGATATDPGAGDATDEDAPVAKEPEASQLEAPKPPEASQLEEAKPAEASQLSEPVAPEASQLAEPKAPQGGPGL
jgi:hypothetical protein